MAGYQISNTSDGHQSNMPFTYALISLSYMTIRSAMPATVKPPRSLITLHGFNSKGCNGEHTAIQWWRHQMETFSALLAICAGNSPHKGQWRGALMFSLIRVWINGWVNNRESGDLRRYRAHYDVIVMEPCRFAAPLWGNPTISGFAALISRGTFY